MYQTRLIYSNQACALYSGWIKR